MNEGIGQEQFILRVKRHSEMDKVLRSLQEGAMTKAEVQEVGGLSRSYGALRRFGKWFDNINVHTERDDGKTTTMHYTEIMPRQVSIVTSEVDMGGGAGAIAPQSTVEPLQWPMAPPLIEEMENFDKPQWFDLMREMVKEGKHISLEGPPGVGKDTAVQQLAAQEGRALVTIGGDAGFRRRDLIGVPHISAGSSYHEVGEYVAAAVNGWWVLLTEVNAADPDALIYLNAQLAPPYVVTLQGKAYPVHPDFRVFVTYNAGLIGTKPLPQSFKDRFFSVKIPFFTASGLRKRLRAMGLPDGSAPEVRDMNDPGYEPPTYVELHWSDKLIDFGIAMWEAHENGQMRYQITTRRLKDAIDLMNLGLCSNLQDAIKEAVISAIDAPVEARAAKNVMSQTVRIREPREEIRGEW